MIYTCNISVVIAEPGAAEQKWHADGGHLSIWKHLPCHCLNIFLPLVDITEELGPTELRSGESSVQRMRLA
jgi:ectoine hydroxylase-related dioxygenase (phytanoyl-CoA dioxygenase family)